MLLQIILTIGAIRNLEIHQINIKTAFLNEQIDTNIFIRPPERFNPDNNVDTIYKLKKKLYELQQLPCLWNKKINNFLITNNFK